MPTVKKQQPKRKRPAKKKSVKSKPAGKRKKTGTAVDRIQSLGYSSDRKLKLNLYGRSGTGKTTFWATFPEKILALICSGGGVNSGEGLSIDTPENRSRIDTVPITSSEDITELVNHQSSTGEYETIVLDHASGLQEVILCEILGIPLDEIPPQMSWGIASQQEWGEVALQMKTRLRQILNLSNCHVVVVAQEREFEPSESDEIIAPYVASALTPSVVGWLNQACDQICSTHIRRQMKKVKKKVGGKTVERVEDTGKVEYCLRVLPDPIFTTKFRIPKDKAKEVPGSVVDPSFDKLMSFLK